MLKALLRAFLISFGGLFVFIALIYLFNVWAELWMIVTHLSELIPHK